MGIKEAYAATSNDALAVVYDAWADRCDHDLLRYGYSTPTLAVGLCVRYIDRESSILDVCVGTGVIGHALSMLGYEDLIGSEMSAKMIDIARRKKAYRNIYRAEAEKSLEFSDGAFDATIAVGWLTIGHVLAAPGLLNELVRVTRPRGHIIFSLREDTRSTAPLQPQLYALDRRRFWSLLEQTEAFESLPLADRGIKHRLFVYETAA